MKEIFFFFTVGDPSIADEALTMGYDLLANIQYKLDQDLLRFSGRMSFDESLCRRFYVIPNDQINEEFVTGVGIKKDGSSFRYIKDRVGAASIDLSFYSWPSDGEISVGSLSFQSTTYHAKCEKLEARPHSFSEAFRNLSSFIKQLAYPVANMKTPKSVFAFPSALSILQKDISRSPWPSIRIDK